MRLVMVRHADAGDRDEFATTGKPDDLRPLSAKGRKQIAATARGLTSLVDACDLLVTSPLTRARQTAEVVAEAFGMKRIETAPALEPDARPDAFCRWLGTRAEPDTVFIVGHEPHLGVLATWLLTGLPDARIEFRKGGACLLEFEGDVVKGEGTLRWLMGPKELAAVGEAS